jgi:hypothetical protein
MIRWSDTFVHFPSTFGGMSSRYCGNDLFMYFNNRFHFLELYRLAKRGVISAVRKKCIVQVPEIFDLSANAKFPFRTIQVQMDSIFCFQSTNNNVNWSLQ